jgi:hypothetical protein
MLILDAGSGSFRIPTADPGAVIAQQSAIIRAGSDGVKQHFEDRIDAERVGQNRPEVIAALERELRRRTAS